MKFVVVLKGFILHKGKVLTVQRAHDDEVGGGTWELVGGQIHFGEDLEAALLHCRPMSCCHQHDVRLRFLLLLVYPID